MEHNNSTCNCWKCKARKVLKYNKVDHGNDFMAWRQAFQGTTSGMTQDRGIDSGLQGLSIQNDTPSVRTKPTLSLKIEPRLDDSGSFNDSFDSFRSTSSPAPDSNRPPFRDGLPFQMYSPIKSVPESSGEDKVSAPSTTTGGGFGSFETAMDTGFGSQNGWFGGNDATDKNPWGL